MQGLLATIPVAVVVFATTNIDDLIVLTFLFIAARDGGRPRAWQVAAGQAAGIATLTAAAAAAAAGLLMIPARWTGLLGVLPLALGAWKLATARRRPPGQDTPAPMATGVAGVTALTIINGADNIAIYTPLLRTLTTAQALAALATFAAMIGIWCAAAAWLASRLAAITAIQRLSHRLVPITLVIIGAILLITVI